MTNPFPAGGCPDPSHFVASLGTPLPAHELGDNDPWNHAPTEVLERLFNAQAAGEQTKRYTVDITNVSTGRPHEVPAVLNWIPGGCVAGLFWYDMNWWFYADTPEIAVSLWNADIAGHDHPAPSQ